MAETMRAAVLEAPHRMVVGDVPLPQPGEGWVRVKTSASGICGSDLHIYTGNHPWLAPGSPMADRVLGNVYGHEIAGVVDEVGPGVTAVAVGDRVAVNGIVPCLSCAWCRVGEYQICPNLEHYGFQISGGFAEYVPVPEASAVRLPDEVPLEHAALLDVLVVGIHAVHRAGVTLADRVAVLGAGPIGLAVAAAARRAGARHVAIAVRHPRQRAIAETIGVDSIIERGDEASRVIADHAGGLGFDVVIEAVGYRASALREAVDLARRGGRIVFTGVYEEPVALDYGTVLAKELSIVASHAFGLWGIATEFELAVEMMQRGEFPAADLITHRFPLDAINDAFRLKLDTPADAVKVAIIFD